MARRARGEELMDRPDVPEEELRVALEHVAEANYRFAGLRSLVRHLTPYAAGRAELSLLDVGVGNGAICRAVSRAFARRGVRVRWVGLDLHPVALRIARAELAGAGGLGGLVRGEATRLPFSDGAFDVSTATLTMHHLVDADCVATLSEMARVSRLAVVVSDLERGLVNYLGAQLLSMTLWRRDRLTRHDAGLSVRRSFTASELLALGRRAPFSSVRVRRHFPFRLVLEGRR